MAIAEQSAVDWMNYFFLVTLYSLLLIFLWNISGTTIRAILAIFSFKQIKFR
jgi:hypothetical protein